MAPIPLSAEENAFTVINHEVKEPVIARNVNVVKPLQRDDGRTHLPSATKDQLEQRMATIVPQTILDPKFSRALDFKLRRLKEKEILEANLRRPTRFRRRPGALTVSNPNISWKERTPPSKVLSQSQPRVDILSDGERTKTFPNMEKSVQKTRKVVNVNDVEKPRFVTTVRTGQFLLPPPEVASLLGLKTLYPPQEREKIMYSYSSKPKALAPRTKRSVNEKSNGVLSNNIPDTNQGSEKRLNAGQAFRNVRSLIAGVAGVQRLLEQRDQIGSMTTTATGVTQHSNLMHDKRVVRGSTFTGHPQAAGDSIESAAARAARTRRRALARRAALARLRPGTPPPAPGRRHLPVQTERYLEELFDKGVELEVGVQTELLADRPATPLYVPAKTGADAATQIYPGDLFDFDLEVQPILEVLVGKTAEQALAETAQEEELATLREQQRRYRELRDAELAERRRLAAQHERLHLEKERRVAEARAAQAAGEEARRRVAAAALVQGYVAELLPAALAGLRDAGYLVRRLQRGVDEEFMPWLIQEVSLEIESIITSRDVITEIVRDVVEARAELYGGAAERRACRHSPPDSATPPSAPDEGVDE